MKQNKVNKSYFKDKKHQASIFHINKKKKSQSPFTSIGRQQLDMTDFRLPKIGSAAHQQRPDLPRKYESLPTKNSKRSTHLNSREVSQSQINNLRNSDLFPVDANEQFLDNEASKQKRDISHDFFKVEIKAARKTVKADPKPKETQLARVRYSDSQERFYIPDPEDFIQYVERQEARKQSQSFLLLDRNSNQSQKRESLVTEEVKPSQSRITLNNTPANRLQTKLNGSMSDMSIQLLRHNIDWNDKRGKRKLQMQQSYANSPQSKSKDVLGSAQRNDRKFVKKSRQFKGNKVVLGQNGSYKLESQIVDKLIDHKKRKNRTKLKIIKNLTSQQQNANGFSSVMRIENSQSEEFIDQSDENERTFESRSMENEDLWPVVDAREIQSRNVPPKSKNSRNRGSGNVISSHHSQDSIHSIPIQAIYHPQTSMIVQRQYASSGRVIPLRNGPAQELRSTLPKFASKPANKFKRLPKSKVSPKAELTRLSHKRLFGLRYENGDINEVVTLPGPKFLTSLDTRGLSEQESRLNLQRRSLDHFRSKRLNGHSGVPNQKILASSQERAATLDNGNSASGTNSRVLKNGLKTSNVYLKTFTEAQWGMKLRKMPSISGGILKQSPNQSRYLTSTPFEIDNKS